MGLGCLPYRDYPVWTGMDYYRLGLEYLVGCSYVSRCADKTKERE